MVYYDQDYESLMRDVQTGVIDYGLLPSAWFEVNHPDLIPQFLFHNITPAAFEDEPYPFATTTPLVPNIGLAAAPSVPWLLRAQIFDALLALNASHPAAAAAADIAAFTLPASYEPERVLVEQMGLLVTSANGSSSCKDPFAAVMDLITCPDGWLTETPATAQAGSPRAPLRVQGSLTFSASVHFVSSSPKLCPAAICSIGPPVCPCSCDAAPVSQARCIRAGMSCPLGSQCVCRPCTHDLSVEVFSSSIVLGLCCSLMVVALLLSCGWRCGIGLAVLLRRSTKRVRKWLARLSLSRPGHTQRVQSRLPMV